MLASRVESVWFEVAAAKRRQGAPLFP